MEYIKDQKIAAITAVGAAYVGTVTSVSDGIATVYFDSMQSAFGNGVFVELKSNPDTDEVDRPIEDSYIYVPMWRYPRLLDLLRAYYDEAFEYEDAHMKSVIEDIQNTHVANLAYSTDGDDAEIQVSLDLVTMVIKAEKNGVRICDKVVDADFFIGLEFHDLIDPFSEDLDEYSF